MTRNSLVLQSQEPLPQSGFSYPSPGSGNPHSQQCTNDFLLLDNWINTILLSTQPQEHAPLSTSLAQPGPTFRIPALSDTRHASQMAAFPSGCVCELLSHVRLCNPIDCSPPGPSIHGILQARTLEWVAISSSKRNYRKKESEVAQLCPTLCDPMDCSLPGSSIHGIFQARELEWVAISFSNGKSRQSLSKKTQANLPGKLTHTTWKSDLSVLFPLAKKPIFILRLKLWCVLFLRLSVFLEAQRSSFFSCYRGKIVVIPP